MFDTTCLRIHYPFNYNIHRANRAFPDRLDAILYLFIYLFLINTTVNYKTTVKTQKAPESLNQAVDYK